MIDAKVLALGVLLPLSFALPATAQDGPPRGAGMFEQLDANGDGALSLEELQSRPDRFASADADGDGTITRDEMLARATERAEARIDQFFETFDSDGDGAVTEAEIAEVRDARQADRREEMAERIFDRMDADGDGQISAEEFAEARERMGERMMGRGGEGRGGLFGHRG